MAPKVPVSLSAARTRATEDTAESQDSQAVMAAMHRLHGIGVRSSSPIDPLEYDDELMQHIMQQPRPPKVHQQHVGNAHVAPASLTVDKSMSKSKSKLNAKARPADRDKNPAVTATLENKGSFAQSAPADKGLDSSWAPDTAPTATAPATAPSFVPSSQARSTDASNDRVSNSLCHSPQSRHLSCQSTHSQTDVSPIPPIDETKLHSNGHSQLNETIPSSLNAAAPVGLPPSSINPRLLSLGNDASKSLSQCHSPKSQPSVKPAVKTYSKKRRSNKKMASSSHSSTQSNDGRSYEQYLPRGDDLISSDPVRQPRLPHSSRQSSPSPRNTEITVHDDDTAQVVFDYSALARLETQTSVPDSTRNEYNTQQHQQQHINSDYVCVNPETPAAPRNPFLGSRSAALMPSSQMFKQFSSAFKATFSPTSSRPSPDHLHLNSISPNPSPLKRVAAGPSPLQGASSLPQLPLVYDTSPQQADEDDPAADDEDIVRSQVSKSFHFPAHKPIEEYRPVQRWDLRAASAQSGSDMEGGPDEDMSDEEERRRRRAALMRAKAQKRLKAIPFERQSDEAIVPATNQEEITPTARQYLDQCDGVSRRDSQSSVDSCQDGAPDVTDSQDGRPQSSAGLPGQPSTGGHISSNDVVPNTDPGPTFAPVQIDDELAVQIPETSPPRLRALGDLMPHSSEEDSKPGSFSKLLSSPFVHTSAGACLGVVSRPTQQRTSDVLDADENLGMRADNDARDSCIIVSSSPPAPAFSTRARLRGGRPPATAPPTSSSTSPLSRLTTTPALSNKTTPLTEESPRNDLTPSSTSTGEVDNSPAVAKAYRQTSKHVSKHASKPAPTTLRASTRRTTRQSFTSNASVSTDELAKSPRPSTPTAEQTTRVSRLGRTSLRESPASRTNSRGGSKIFSGMAFAVSFQGRKPGERDAQYEARITNSRAITSKIKQAGGKVLPDGFDHLFEFVPVKNAVREASSVSSTPQPDDDIALAPQARDTGFTALIADGHSRKVKYMQALALGLPCIHERWITACVDKQRLVDWADYLLCAGNSSFLGNAIRSRNLTPYDAATAKLSEVIQYRPRLLDQSRILLLMTRGDESKKKAYIFLARVLGASLSRAYTVEEARQQLKAREDAGRAFDWIYMVDEKVDVEEMFQPPGAKATGGSRKRKRRKDTSKGEVSTAPPAKRVRALSDELVVQSLILGRLMDEGEMKAEAG